MKLIQDCLVPITKPVRWVEPERVNIFHVLACTTYSAFARFGAEVRGWFTPHDTDDRNDNDGGTTVAGGARTRGTTSSGTALVESPTSESRVSEASRTVRTAPARIPVTMVTRQATLRSPGGCTEDDCVHQRELSRVRRDLHDQVGSSLAGMTMQLEVAQRLLRSDADRAVRMLDELHSATSDLFTTVREMSARRRRRQGIRGGDGGTLPAGGEGCDNVAEALRRMTGRMQCATRDRMEIALDLGDGVESVRGDVGRAAFWIVNEALTNVLRHSHARRCQVSLWASEDELHLRVEDNGLGGIDATPGASHGGSGLGNMAERAAEHGGWCTVRNGVPAGVVVLASLPLATREGNEVRSASGSGSRDR